MRTIIRALPAVVGAFILGGLASAAGSATAARGREIGYEAVLVALAAVAACVLLTWLTRRKNQKRPRRTGYTYPQQYR